MIQCPKLARDTLYDTMSKTHAKSGCTYTHTQIISFFFMNPSEERKNKTNIRGSKHRNDSKECLFINDSDIQSAHFLGSPLRQATKQHLNNS